MVVEYSECVDGCCFGHVQMYSGAGWLYKPCAGIQRHSEGGTDNEYICLGLDGSVQTKATSRAHYSEPVSGTGIGKLFE